MDKAEVMARESVAVHDVEVMPALPSNRDGTMPANAYDEETVFAALTAIMEKGESITETALRMGISKPTIERWLHKYKEDRKIFHEIDNVRLADKMTGKIDLLLDGLTKDKINKAWPKDIAIALGVIADKRKDLIGPTTGAGETTLKIAWQNGSGAVELKTSSPPK